MNLHENKQLFSQAVRFTSDQVGIPAIYIEKDYWVTYALHTLAHNSIGSETIFKGGTALSKCFDLIQRFSEDIDLVVLRREGETNNQLTTKIRTISKVVSNVLPEVDIAEVTQKMGMNRKTAHTYSKEFQGDYGQVRDVIIVEATWLGYYEPYTTKTVRSFIFDMMENTGQLELAKEYDLLPFEFKVLAPVRTICEKIMSLVRFSHTENPIEDLTKKIRHTYDLHLLLKNKDLSTFFKSNDFEEMLLKVANDDVASFKNNNKWLQYHPTEAKIFAELESVWDILKATYNGDFKKLMYGDEKKKPIADDILKTLTLIKERLSTIDWTIRIEVNN